MCEESDDPAGVELAGVAKNAAALAAGATVGQGLNVAGAAAGHIFSEVWRWALTRGATATSMIGLAGTGDLVATALAPESRNRRAGELLAEGVPAAAIAARVGQAVEALETVPLLAKALADAGLEAPVTTALGRLSTERCPSRSGWRWCERQSRRHSGAMAARPVCGVVSSTGSNVFAGGERS